MTAQELLNKCADQFEKDPASWTQGALARNMAGIPVKSLNKEAVCWCSIGMMEKLNGNSEVSNAIGFLRQAAKEVSVIDWNDRPRQEVEKVIARFREAAELAGKEGL